MAFDHGVLLARSDLFSASVYLAVKQKPPPLLGKLQHMTQNNNSWNALSAILLRVKWYFQA
jgi:hypothetical protein